jgi:hypothetical protein
MALPSSFRGLDKPDAGQIRKDVLTKLEKIDLSSIKDMTGNTKSDEADGRIESAVTVPRR